MKTKTLLIAAAALAAGVMSSQAQGVYSQNIVGYVNVTLPAGYSMVANQMDLDGTGTNNSIYTSIGTNLPPKSIVLCWDPTTASYAETELSGTGKWSLNNNIVSNAMNPGAGFFIDVPVATNVTLVGSVLTGTNTYPVLAGYQIISPITPVAGTITALGYTATKRDTALIWDNATASYAESEYSGTAWSGSGAPNFAVGQAVFLDAAVSTNWTEVLNVQ